MHLRRAVARGVLVLAAAVALTTVSIPAVAQVAAPLPAAAPSPASTDTLDAYSTCYVTNWITSCKTATIRANSYYHDIYYQACASSSHYADWQVEDANNGVIVGQGRVAAGTCRSGYIGGLYGSYWGWVFNTRPYSSMTISD